MSTFCSAARSMSSAASLPGLAERTVLISAFRRRSALRAGASAIWRRMQSGRRRSATFHDLTYVCSPSPAQYGAAAGLAALDQDFYRHMSTDYEKKTRPALWRFDDAGLKPSVPDGAYYVLADATTLPGATAREKARALAAEDRRGSRGRDPLSTARVEARTCFGSVSPSRMTRLLMTVPAVCAGCRSEKIGGASRFVTHPYSSRDPRRGYIFN